MTTQTDTPAPFTWWDDALELARVRAIFTGRRQAVRAWLGGWIVEEVGP